MILSDKNQICSFLMSYSSILIHLGNKADFEAYCTVDTITKKYKCSICHNLFTTKDMLFNHLEGIHFHDSFIYACTLCEAVFNTRNKLRKHKVKNVNYEK